MMNPYNWYCLVKHVVLNQTFAYGPYSGWFSGSPHVNPEIRQLNHMTIYLPMEMYPAIVETYNRNMVISMLGAQTSRVSKTKTSTLLRLLLCSLRPRWWSWPGGCWRVGEAKCCLLSENRIHQDWKLWQDIWWLNREMVAAWQCDSHEWEVVWI